MMKKGPSSFQICNSPISNSISHVMCIVTESKTVINNSSTNLTVVLGASGDMYLFATFAQMRTINLVMLVRSISTSMSCGREKKKKLPGTCWEWKPTGMGDFLSCRFGLTLLYPLAAKEELAMLPFLRASPVL